MNLFSSAALGYAEEKRFKFDLGLIRNHYVGRTFIEPSQQIRSLGVKLKLNPNISVIKNKKIILVDDSLVRGTTSHKIIKMLYDSGAKEVHLRIASPEIKFPDFYGIDMPSKKELLAANKSAIKNKKIILVDDSLVRGTTSYKIVKMLYDAGAKEVHVKIACPEIKYPDFYGVDTPTKKELLAANKTNDEICKYIGAKSLKFLSLNGMYRAVGFEKRNENYPQLTDHYFTGDYPVKPIDELGDNKITQLSLLNTASNN